MYQKIDLALQNATHKQSLNVTMRLGRVELTNTRTILISQHFKSKLYL
jgi:hypothetical protein